MPTPARMAPDAGDVLGQDGTRTLRANAGLPTRLRAELHLETDRSDCSCSDIGQGMEATMTRRWPSIVSPRSAACSRSPPRPAPSARGCCGWIKRLSWARLNANGPQFKRLRVGASATDFLHLWWHATANQTSQARRLKSRAATAS